MTPQTHNSTTDAIRAAYSKALANQPTIPAADRQRALELLELSRGWALEAYDLLKIAPQFSEPLVTAGRQLRSITARLKALQ